MGGGVGGVSTGAAGSLTVSGWQQRRVQAATTCQSSRPASTARQATATECPPDGRATASTSGPWPRSTTTDTGQWWPLSTPASMTTCSARSMAAPTMPGRASRMAEASTRPLTQGSRGCICRLPSEQPGGVVANAARAGLRSFVVGGCDARSGSCSGIVPGRRRKDEHHGLDGEVSHGIRPGLARSRPGCCRSTRSRRCALAGGRPDTRDGDVTPVRRQGTSARPPELGWHDRPSLERASGTAERGVVGRCATTDLAGQPQTVAYG